MEKPVYSSAASFFVQVDISYYKQRLKRSAWEISTMLHTDFVNNVCLFFRQRFLNTIWLA